MLAGSVSLAQGVHAQALETDEAKLSYSLGVMIGENILIHDFQSLDTEAFRMGIDTVYGNQDALMTPEEIMATMQAFQQTQMEAQRAAFAAQAAENLSLGEAFLAENAAKSGVTTTATGLQYEQLEAGEGASPTAADVVKVHYRGHLIDGTEFDSSYSRGEPISFPLSGVIPGWTEGLQLMQVGEKARLVIPSDLAYGPNGMGNAIGPNETLVFEVELLEINPEMN
ncbi:MAG: FKBP-type peptidyl-prolyl cis-trans isomerase [Nitrincola sp.]|nr:FKBP-type peptidyl-prolyl cis-trans isomerase [Nitrincola sp.]